MIKATPKPLEDIIEFVKDYNKILVAGCDGCVTVCEAGGMKEVKVLAASLRLNFTQAGTPKEIDEISLSGGKVSFSDFSPKEPFKTTLSPVEVKVLHFSNIFQPNTRPFFGHSHGQIFYVLQGLERPDGAHIIRISRPFHPPG